jgi:catechol 2,3-dioxygenase-like lactoylglutathione lyase family enzyme
MRRSISGIDHAVVLARDLDAARASYERLGFTVAPRGVHPSELGTANHTVMLEREYLELMGIVAPTPANAPYRSALERGEGLAALALQTQSADAVVAEMAAAGVALDAAVDFARPVLLSDGVRTQASFRTAHFPAGVAPGFHVFCCEHRTRHVTWRPELLRHANGALALDHVLAVSDDPAADALRCGALFASEPTKGSDGAVVVDTGNSTIRFHSARSLAARVAGADLADLRRAGLVGLSLRTASAADAEAALARGGVRAARTPSGIVVAAADACGVLLVFAE